jgi:hypothetical protein
MAKVNRTHMKRIRNLVALCTIIAVTLSVSTYAWFVGMRTVNVASFDVEIKTTDSLQLSLDGTTWSESVTLSPDRANATDPLGTPASYYAGSTNNWPELIPVSTIGEMDQTASRMILFEKASFTPTKGGYRIMNSRVANDTGSEGDGYVVFDLFIKNFSGKGYITGLNQEDEEGIYLTIDSAAVVSSLGGVANTGIENSVRVAFAQIGRVKADTTTQSTVTGITCSTAGDVTGICRQATIWEPNDIRHVEAAISYYDTSCLERTLGTVADGSYTANKCKTLVDGTAYSTYAVRKAIASADGVDIYDGEYNSYMGNVGTDKSLLAVDTFTDSEKLKTGTARGEFMTLAANSITKVRVYIYIEGQDIDNYDFSSIGKKISINFGFTKERFTPGDIQYTGPEISDDTQKPVISLKGASPYIMSVGGTYTEPGAIVVDNVDGDISGSVVIDSTAVQASTAGEYSVTYTATDSSTNQTVVTRKVIVRE